MPRNDDKMRNRRKNGEDKMAEPLLEDFEKMSSTNEQEQIREDSAWYFSGKLHNTEDLLSHEATFEPTGSGFFYSHKDITEEEEVTVNNKVYFSRWLFLAAVINQ